VWADGVVVRSPAIDLLPGVVDADEPVLVEAFVAALLHGSARSLTRPTPTCSHAATATESGMPSFVIRLSAFTASLASLVWAPRFFARSLSHAPTPQCYRTLGETRVEWVV